MFLKLRAMQMEEYALKEDMLCLMKPYSLLGQSNPCLSLGLMSQMT
jgi:hypothetical protein